MTHTMYDAFDTGIQASTAYVKNHFHYNDPSDVNLKQMLRIQGPRGDL